MEVVYTKLNQTSSGKGTKNYQIHIFMLVPFSVAMVTLLLKYCDKENLEKVTKYIPSKEQFQSEYKRQTKKLRTKLRKIF